MPGWETDDRLGPYREIADFQLAVASRWEAIGKDCAQPAFAFLSFFSALNAIYWLWGITDARAAFSPEELGSIAGALSAMPEEVAVRVIDELEPRPRGESRLISDLIDKLGEDAARQIFDDPGVQQSVAYFARRAPIRRMGKRGNDPLGDISEGKRYKRRLGVDSPTARLQALGGILYLVRCNLVHGSKSMDELDEELLTNSVPPLRQLVSTSTRFTEASVAGISLH